jgi:cyanate lyase
MPYINNDGDSRLNNFPVEPKMYTAEPTDPSQQRNYMMVMVIGIVLVGGLIFVATAVS